MNYIQILDKQNKDALDGNSPTDKLKQAADGLYSVAIRLKGILEFHPHTFQMFATRCGKHTIHELYTQCRHATMLYEEAAGMSQEPTTAPEACQDTASAPDSLQASISALDIQLKLLRLGMDKHKKLLDEIPVKGE